MKKKVSRELKDSESKLWEKVVFDVNRKHPKEVVETDNEKIKENNTKNNLKKTAETIFDEAKQNPSPVRKILSHKLPILTIGKPQGIDRKTATRLKRGQIKIDGKLDLHGYNQIDAFNIISRYIADSRQNGKRCLLIITGKGSSSESTGILRQMLPIWLNEPEIRENVLALEKAQPRDGGSGAFYILIKRNKKSV